MNEVVAETSSMKGMQNEINDYDKERVQVIGILVREEQVAIGKPLQPKEKVVTMKMRV